MPGEPRKGLSPRDQSSPERPVGSGPGLPVEWTTPELRASGGAASNPRTDAPVPLDSLNAETSLTALQSDVTPARGFFVRSHFAPPALRASSWRLSVTGEVERARKWTLDELRLFPRVRVVATLECAGNSRQRFPNAVDGELRWGDRAVGTAVWEGVPLSLLLEEAGPRPEARQIVFTGADTGNSTAGPRRFSRSLSVDALDGSGDILVATEMNGVPLPAVHGWPARLIVPGWYGMAWVKWLSTINLRTRAFGGYYQASRYVYAYHQNGKRFTKPVTRIRVKSLIISPRPGEHLPWGQPHVITGKAWSGSGPVTQVEVDTGSGWAPARLRPGNGSYDWSSWEFGWSPRRRGPVNLRVRATDAEGETQPEEPFLNDFQYGMNAVHSVGVVVS